MITLILIAFLSCGTTGRIIFYDFPASKYEIEEVLLKVIRQDSAYIVPDKWKIEHEDVYPMIYIYFNANPEEIYQIGFSCDSLDWNSSPSYSKLALIAKFDGDQFKFEKDLNRKEKERIEERFETEILAKIRYNYIKNNETKTCSGR